MVFVAVTDWSSHSTPLTYDSRHGYPSLQKMCNIYIERLAPVAQEVGGECFLPPGDAVELSIDRPLRLGCRKSEMKAQRVSNLRFVYGISLKFMIQIGGFDDLENGGLELDIDVQKARCKEASLELRNDYIGAQRAAAVQEWLNLYCRIKHHVTLRIRCPIQGQFKLENSLEDQEPTSPATTCTHRNDASRDMQDKILRWQRL